MARKEKADAIQWAINLADSQMKRDARTPEERHYIYELEDLKRRCEGDGYRAFSKPT